MLKLTITTVAVLGLAVTMTDLEAKRVGGGRTSGSSRPAATKPTPKTEEPATPSSTTKIGPRISVSSPSSSQNPAPATVPAAAAGVAAGSAAAAVAVPEPAPVPDPAALRQQNEEKLLRAAEEEEKRRAIDAKRNAAIAAYEQEQAERQKQFTKQKEERDARRAKLARESECQFKAVMTEDDMAKCRAIYR